MGMGLILRVTRGDTVSVKDQAGHELVITSLHEGPVKLAFRGERSEFTVLRSKVARRIAEGIPRPPRGPESWGPDGRVR